MSEITGIISISKPLEWTSMEVVRRVKRLTRQKRVGHAGTLDPQATGVLPICFGQATRVMEFLVDSPKVYKAVIRLGVSTNTYDSQGQVNETNDPSSITLQDVERELESFRGVFLQVPPMYSALKRDGERLYNLARAGKEVEREPREVEIYSSEITSWQSPDVEVEVMCGRGMYIRSLAHDLGAALGCGAHLKELARLRTGPFDIDNSATMPEMEEACENGSWESLVFPVDYPLSNMRAAVVQREKEEAVRKGQGVYLGMPLRGISPTDRYRLYSVDGDFIAIIRPGRVKGLWNAQKVFNLRTPDK